MSEELSLREVRLQKLARMRELGHDPYAIERFERDRSAQQLLDRFDGLQGQTVKFAGRLHSRREMGKAGFAHVSDGEGKIQLYFRKDDLEPVQWELFGLLDIGDQVGVSGELFLTKTGEKSIHVRNFVVLAKCLHDYSFLAKEKDGELLYAPTDPDFRYRARHMDLTANIEARKALLNRARIVSAVRRYFDGEGYLEVETPLLQLEAGGASAKPFVTHYNAYEMDMKLRISLELYLKRIICGDVPKVYEVGRVFRNEGLSSRHNPEFTLLEFYEAYVDLEAMMQRVEDCFRSVAQSVFGTTTVDVGPRQLDFAKPWIRVSLLEEIERHTGLTSSDLSDLETAISRAKALDVPGKAQVAGGFIDLAKEDNLGGFIEKLLEVFVEPTLQDPTFVVGYPIETSPLAKKDPTNPKMTRRFEGYVLGREVCNAFSEINDPIDQRERFEHQVSRKAAGDDEAHPMDEDFLFALECGMPPTGGCGIGLDRMAMLLTGVDGIREVLFFPTMRPQS